MAKRNKYALNNKQQSESKSGVSPDQAAQSNTIDGQTTQPQQQQQEEDDSQQRTNYTRSAKTAARQRIGDCFNPIHSTTRSRSNPRLMDQREEQQSNDNKQSSEISPPKKPRLDSPNTSDDNQIVETPVTEQTSSQSDINSDSDQIVTNEVNGEISHTIYPQSDEDSTDFIGSFHMQLPQSQFIRQRPFFLERLRSGFEDIQHRSFTVHSSNNLRVVLRYSPEEDLESATFNDRDIDQRMYPPERINELISMLHLSDAETANSILTELSQHILLNTEESMKRILKREFIETLSAFIPPKCDNAAATTNSITACRIFSYLCESITGAAAHISIATKNLLACFDTLGVVDIAESALKVLELLASRGEARTILLTGGVERCVRIFPFLTSLSGLSVLRIIGKSIASIKPSKSELKLILPFFEFFQQGINLEDAQTSYLVFSAAHKLVLNLQPHREVLQLIAECDLFTDCIRKKLSKNEGRIKFRILHLQCLSALCTSSEDFAKSILSELDFKKIEEIWIRGTLPSNSYQRSSQVLMEVLTFIDLLLWRSFDKVNEKLDGDNEIIKKLISTRVIWQYRESGSWQSFNMTDCWNIETAFLNNQNELILSFDTHQITLYLDRMLYIREDNALIRPLQRISLDHFNTYKNTEKGIETLIETLLLSIFRIVSNCHYIASPTMRLRCWTLITKMLTYLTFVSSNEFRSKLSKELTGLNWGRSLCELLNSSFVVLNICGLHCLFCFMYLNLGEDFYEQFELEGVFSMVEKLKTFDTIPMLPMKRFETRTCEDILSSQQGDYSETISETVRFRICNDSLMYSTDAMSTQRPQYEIPHPSVVFRTRQAQLNSQRHNINDEDNSVPSEEKKVIGTIRDILSLKFYYNKHLPTYISSLACYLSTFRKQSNQSIVAINELSCITKNLMNSDQCNESLLKLFDLIEEGLTPHQLMESEMVNYLYTYLVLNDELPEKKFQKMKEFMSTLLSTPNKFKTFIKLLIDCVYITEKIHMMPLNELHYQTSLNKKTSSVLVRFTEEPSDPSSAILKHIGPTFYPSRMTVRDCIPSILHFLTHERYGQELFNAEKQYVMDPTIHVEVFFKNKKCHVDWPLYLFKQMTDSKDKFIPFTFKIHQRDPCSPNTKFFLTHLLTISSIYHEIENNTKYQLLLLRLLVEMYRLRIEMDICYNVDIDLNEFQLIRFSNYIVNILTNPILLSNTQFTPKWIKYLVFECPALLSYEARQIVFSILHLPRILVINRLIERNIVYNSFVFDENNRYARKKISVDRNKIFKDGEDVFLKASPSILEVTFDREVGYGVGPTNEFFSLVSKEFNYQSDIWCSNNNNMGHLPIPIMRRMPKIIMNKVKSKFRYLGKFLAKSILDHKLIDMPLNVAFYKWLLNMEQTITFHDLKYVDFQIYKQLLVLKEKMDGIDISCQSQTPEQISESINKELKEYCLNFTLPGFPEIEMVKNGRNVDVDVDNFKDYIVKIINCRMIEGIRRQLEIVKSAFTSLLPLKSLRCFFPNELHYLICGQDDDDWTLPNLVENVKLVLGYTDQSETIQYLFKWLSSLSKKERRVFMQFVSGSPCLPYGGLKSLSPPLTVARAGAATQADCDLMLPSAMTCKTYLKLPPYSSYDILREKFEFALYEGQNSFMLS